VRLDAIRWRGVSKVFVATGALATVAVVAIVVGTLGARSLPAVAGTEEVPAVEPGDLGLMVVGDSVAVGLAFEAGAVSDASGLTVLNSAIVGCGVTDGVSIPDEPVNEGGAEHRCDGRTAQWRDQLERFEPDVVLVGWGAFEVYPLEVDGELLEPGSAAHREYVRAQLEADVDVLAATGAPVAFLNVHCMQEHLWSGEEPRDRNEPERVEALNEVLAGVAADRPEMTILDVRAQVCPDGTYQEEVDGIDLFRDGVHYSQEGARWLWGWLAGEIARVAGEAA